MAKTNTNTGDEILPNDETALNFVQLLSLQAYLKIIAAKNEDPNHALHRTAIPLALYSIR